MQERTTRKTIDESGPSKHRGLREETQGPAGQLRAMLQLQQDVGNERTQRAVQASQKIGNSSVRGALASVQPLSRGRQENPPSRSPLAYPLFGDWLENATPERDGFWGHLRDALADELENYLSNIHGEAVDTWIQHMNSSGESGAGNILFNVFKSAVGLVPGGGNLAAAVMGTAQDIYNFIDDQSPNNRMSFADFVTNQSQAHTRFSGEITRRSHRLFSAVDELRGQETEENKEAKRQEALAQSRRGRARLPSFHTVYRGLVEAWIRGAQDSWDSGDWGPEDAGYIYATCHHFHGGGGFGNFRAFVDDVERPEGVIKTIQQGWDPRGRVNLDELPFAMTVTVKEMSDTGTQRGFRQTGTTKLQKPVGDGPLTFVSGNEGLLRAYMSRSRRINASDLTTD